MSCSVRSTQRLKESSSRLPQTRTETQRICGRSGRGPSGDGSVSLRSGLGFRTTKPRLRKGRTAASPLLVVRYTDALQLDVLSKSPERGPPSIMTPWLFAWAFSGSGAQQRSEVHLWFSNTSGCPFGPPSDQDGNTWFGSTFAGAHNFLILTSQ